MEIWDTIQNCNKMSHITLIHPITTTTTTTTKY